MEVFADMTFGMGVIEGFYGPSWSWRFRRQMIEQLAALGFSTYIYAPKGQALLRSQWRAPFPDVLLNELTRLSLFSKGRGVAFGVGFSPLGAQQHYSKSDQATLISKVKQLNTIGCDRILICFDDMPVDSCDAAKRQAEIVDDIRTYSDAQKIALCPSYYSADRVLDELFGKRPDGYFSALRSNIGGDIAMAWTGPKVISPCIDKEHLASVANELGGKPLLWDNFWANDGRVSSEYLPIRPLAKRPKDLASVSIGCLFNPSNQPYLAALQMCLASEYFTGEQVSQPHSFLCSLEYFFDKAFAETLYQDLEFFNERGIGSVSDVERQHLLARYSHYEEPLARDICDWLAGEKYAFDPSCLTG